MEDTKPLVTCITTTFNKFQYFFQTLDSIFDQDYPNIELIISDDGSKEYPEEDVVKYVQEHKKENIKKVIYNVHKENYGTVRNSNINRSLASGKYYFGIGSDDCFCDGSVISDIVDFFETSNAQIVTCQRILTTYDGKTILGFMPFPNEEKYFRKLSLFQQYSEMCSLGYISGACTYMSAELYKSINGFDEQYKYFEDYPTYIKLLREGVKIYFYKRPSIYYRFGIGISTSSKKSNPFKTALYDERIRYTDNEITPYLMKMEWWRRKHIIIKLRSYEIERDEIYNNQFRKYADLFFRSPIGTVVHIYYQLYYKLNIKYGKRFLKRLKLHE